MAQKTKKEVNPRLVRAGDIVHSKNSDTAQVVRGVDVVLQLADGTSEVYRAGEEMVQIAPKEELPTQSQMKAAMEDDDG